MLNAYTMFVSFCPDIFTQQCHFLRQSGHSEKAISLFQAMIDFTFYKPDSVRKLSTKQQVCLFVCLKQNQEKISHFGPLLGLFYLEQLVELVVFQLTRIKKFQLKSK